MGIKIDELKRIAERLEVIEKMLIENALPCFLPAEMVAEKFGITTQTLSNLAKEDIIKKYRLGGRKIYYCIPEIYRVIRASVV